MAGEAHVVKAFNGIHYSFQEYPVFSGFKEDECYCSDYPEAIAVVADLIEDAGFKPLDVGPLENAHLLELLAMLSIRLALIQGMGTKSALKLLRQKAGI